MLVVDIESFLKCFTKESSLSAIEQEQVFKQE
uniref:Uncharacterized protein n=1 Tax=Arundo donax TaxID=35708 RepID=A0A0A9BP89_ARUDO